MLKKTHINRPQIKAKFVSMSKHMLWGRGEETTQEGVILSSNILNEYGIDLVFVMNMCGLNIKNWFPWLHIKIKFDKKIF